MNGRMLLLIMALLSGTVSVEAKVLGTYGATYPIAERDALEEIQERARQVDWQKVLDRRKLESYQGPPDRGTLPRAKRDRTFAVDLTYTMELDVPDGKGGILYPKGYTFNPLEYVVYPKSIVVINGNDPEQLQWFVTSEYADRLDVILLLTEGRHTVVAKRLKRPLFYADQKIIDRFRLKAVPSIVRQKGRFMEVSEIDVRRTTAKKGAGADQGR